MALLSPATSRRSSRRRWLGACAALLVALQVMRGAETPGASPEYQIKAVFLLNFAQFVDWPPSTFPEATSPLVIGVLGRDPFGAALEEAVQGERVNGRPFVIQRYGRAEEAKSCQILFISRSETNRLPTILSALKGTPILTVSDADDFTDLGGMIRFVMEQNKVRFRINLESAKAANLTLSSKLLRPARVVAPEKR